MKGYIVGVVGAGGAVGRILCSQLESNYKVIRGSRRPDQDRDFVFVDYHDVQSLDAFCEQCDIVVNCAGPSYLIQDKIMVSAQRQNAFYVDAFGAQLAEQKREEYRYQRASVVAAGCLPGLTGIAIHELANTNTHENDQFLLYSGGAEGGGKAACADIILSSCNRFGLPNTVIEQGITKGGHSTKDTLLQLVGFPEKVYINPFLTKEMMLLVEQHHIENLSAFQAVPDKAITTIISDACAKYIRGVSLSETVQEADEQIQAVHKGQKEWFSLYAVRCGREDNISKSSIVIRAANSTAVTAAVLMTVIDRIQQKHIAPGIYWGYEVVTIQDFVEAVRHNPEIIEITVNTPAAEIAGTEEGII